MNKLCAVCGKVLKPFEQFGHRETLCWQHWQEFETYLLTEPQLMDTRSREQMLLNFKELYAD